RRRPARDRSARLPPCCARIPTPAGRLNRARGEKSHSNRVRTAFGRGIEAGQPPAVLFLGRPTLRRATHMCTRGGRSLRRESGQVFALAAVVMSGVIGMLAFVVDVGSWYRSHRSTQALVDASALAGAEDLPY